MKKTLFSLVLTLAVSTVFLSLPVYAADDTEPPTLAAWLNGDTLRAEAGDRDSGVEAVYVNGHRFGYLVDGVIEIAVKEYAGTEQHIVVHALDYAGNKSEEVRLDNPHYKAPRETSERETTPTTPAPTPQPPAGSGTAGSGGTSSSMAGATGSGNTSATVPPASGSAAGNQSGAPSGSGNPFTPDGTGSVQDNATEEDGKEFFTITTESDNTFFLVVDRQRDSDGVYLLNTVTENDLLALADKREGPTVSAIPDPEPMPEPVPTPELEEESEEPVEPEPQQNDGGTSTGMVVFMIAVALAAGGAGYYLKVLKPRQNTSPFGDDDSEEYDEDDLDSGGELFDDDPYGDSEEMDEEESLE